MLYYSRIELPSSLPTLPLYTYQRAERLPISVEQNISRRGNALRVRPNYKVIFYLSANFQFRIQITTVTFKSYSVFLFKSLATRFIKGKSRVFMISFLYYWNTIKHYCCRPQVGLATRATSKRRHKRQSNSPCLIVVQWHANYMF